MSTYCPKIYHSPTFIEKILKSNHSLPKMLIIALHRPNVAFTLFCCPIRQSARIGGGFRPRQGETKLGNARILSVFCCVHSSLNDGWGERQEGAGYVLDGAGGVG